MATRKRKPSGPPPLYDHSQSSVPNRTYKRTGNGRHIIISSSQVAVDNGQEEVLYTPPTNSQDFSTDHDDQFIPSNPDTAEAVGIKVTPAKRYENSVSM